MTRSILLLLWGGLVASISVTPASAQSNAPPVSEPLLSHLASGATLARYLDRLRNQFRQLDADGNGELDAADIALHEAIVLAAMRAQHAMQIMSADLDGDGAVTEDELRRKLGFDRRATVPPSPPGGASMSQMIDQEVRRMMAAEADKDGKVTWPEIVAHSKASQANNSQAMNYGPGSQVRRMIAALGGGKENVRLADVEQAGEATFRRVDTNHNGTISQDEIDGMQRLRQQAQMREIEERRNADRLRKEEQARAACRMPAASDAAKIILLSAFNAEALSRIALGSQDVKTGTGEIRIEPGPDPLYVVVVAKDPVIWRLAGATHRVERLVVASAATSKATTPMSVSTGGGTIRLGPTSRPTTVETPAANPVPLVGVTGIERERVSVLPNANCLKHFNEVVSSESASAKAFVRRELGRDPAVVSARINVGSFEIPSGEIRSAYDDKTQPRLVIVKEFGTLKLAGDTSGVVVRTGPIDLDAELEQSSPGGVVNIEEKDVVAIAPLVRYDVLPGPAGLMQLVNSGALSRTRRGEFVISRKIRFPAGLSGHSITFLLRANVPVPDGNADGARVISEETGQEIRLDRK